MDYSSFVKQDLGQTRHFKHEVREGMAASACDLSLEEGEQSCT